MCKEFIHNSSNTITNEVMSVFVCVARITTKIGTLLILSENFTENGS